MLLWRSSVVTDPPAYTLNILTFKPIFGPITVDWIFYLARASPFLGYSFSLDEGRIQGVELSIRSNHSIEIIQRESRGKSR